MSHFYGLALPFLKRGMPVTPVQLENVTVTGYLKAFKTLLLTYQGQKPLTPDVHDAIARWVREGGVLVVCDDDSDPYLKVREWWNSGDRHYRTPREHLFETLGARDDAEQAIGRGRLVWLRENPASFANGAEGEARLVESVHRAAGDTGWRETNYLLLRRGPYVLAAGLDESSAAAPKELAGRFVNLFDPALAIQRKVVLRPGSRYFLLDLDRAAPSGSSKASPLASACKMIPLPEGGYVVEGIGRTQAIVLLNAEKAPREILLNEEKLSSFDYSTDEKLLWIRFDNQATPRKLRLIF